VPLHSWQCVLACRPHRRCCTWWFRVSQHRRKGNRPRRPAMIVGRVHQPAAHRHAAADRPDGDLRPGREAFDGNLRKRDLQTDTPWNTYTRPACRPRRSPCRARRRCWPRCSRATRRCTSWPRATAAAISATTLDEHNRAVNRYQRGVAMPHHEPGFASSASKASTVRASPRTSRPGRSAFRAQGRTVHATREPGGTPLAEKLRAWC
jgi:hypothetical protein